MDAVHREYDRFGPWAVEISEQDPTPSLFEPFVTRREVPLLSLKIPRHVERRDARPGMDLYDYLVSLYRDELVVLRRVDREVRSTTCRLDDVRLLRVTRCLLRGSLHLGLPDGPIDLPYNTVSDALMLRLVALIRERYAPRPVSLSSVPKLAGPRRRPQLLLPALPRGGGQTPDGHAPARRPGHGSAGVVDDGHRAPPARPPG